jgi:hypothetical protein
MIGRKINKNIVLLGIQHEVLKAEDLTLKEFKEKYTEEEQFYKGLYHVTTTKKAICLALKLGIDNSCRYKRKLEKAGKLVESTENFFCPITDHKAKKLSTNPERFDLLLKTNQLKLF